MSIIPVPSTAAGKSNSKSPNGSKSPKSLPPAHEPLVVEPRHELCSAEAVAEPDIEDKTQQPREKDIAKPVEKAHCFAFHRIDEPRAVHEVCRAPAVRIVEPRQPLRRHGEIGIENRQHVAGGSGEPKTNRVGLSLADLLECANAGAPRPSHRAVTRWISSHVPSLECPSTKITSVGAPKSGIRRSAFSILPLSLRAGITMVSEGRAIRPGTRGRSTATVTSDSHRSPGTAGIATLKNEPEAEEMPRHVCNRPQTHQLESGQPRELIQIGLRDERHDRRSLAQAQPVGEPEQPRKIPVVQGHDDAAAAADVRPEALEQALECRSSD